MEREKTEMSERQGELLARLAGSRLDGRELETLKTSALLDLGEELLDRLPPGELDPEAISAEAGKVRELLWRWCDATRRSPFLRRISGTSEGDRWWGQVLAVVDRTHFTTGALFRQRVGADPGRIWLRVVGKDRIVAHTLSEVARRVDGIARGLHALLGRPPQEQPVAILAENSLETVLADLACLTTGIVDTTIPADITGEQAAYILEQTEARVLLVGSDRQLEKIRPVLPSLPGLRWIVRILPPEGPGAHEERILTLDQLLQRGARFPREELQKRAASVRARDAATLMYTSGTTGLPKGIVFSHANLVSKRFARALALPWIGEDDAFLCYLPLYHTFGRWLEMLGTLFWDATYSFMENPSLEAMVDNLKRVAPTVLISIPKKWIQLHDLIRTELPEGTDPRLARPLVERITGGRLRWGLSAAGYLDPAVFRFFQEYGIELMSGFGMTEATGGITMTPPGDYREGTVGRALPGIEIRRDNDGELLVRGPYVMQGYFGPDEGQVDHRVEWFHTGDLVTVDGDGFVTIVDRKKDIYKNVKGQTVSPQRVESLFQGFGEIRQVFLVGDGREYNTLLIYPNYEYDAPPLASMPPAELREYLSNVVVSVNAFLAPFERVLDFAVLPRPLALEEEELTPKGTYRRKVVEQHFAEAIDGMYRDRYSRLTAGGTEVHIPHWLLRDMGLTLSEVACEPGILRVPRLERSLHLSHDGEVSRVGDLWYSGAEAVDLEILLRSPELWLGNAELIEFTGPAGIRRPRPRSGESEGSVQVAGIADIPQMAEHDRTQLEDALWREDRSLLTMHRAAVALLSSGEKEGLRLVSYFENLAAGDDSQRANLARIALRRAVAHPKGEVRSAAFRALLPHGAPEMVGPTLLSFLGTDPHVLNQAGAVALARRGLPEEIMAAFVTFLAKVQRSREAQRRNRVVDRTALDEQRTLALLRFLVVYAVDHPGWFKAARAELSRWMLSRESARLREFARKGLERLTAGFREWLGPDPRLAVDPLSGHEYGWPQVLRFDPECDPADRTRIQEAFDSVPLLKEAIFVLSGGNRVSLADIPQGGVRIRRLGARHGKAVYRLTVQTRQSGTFEVALNLVKEIAPEAVESEVVWLTRLGTAEGGRRLVEEMGGYWSEQALWTEEFVPGETVSALVERLARLDQEEDSDRLPQLWPHLAWSSVTAYVDFWNRTAQTLVPGDPSPDNLIVPAHDYQEGSRLVSISERREFRGLPSFMRGLKEGIFDAVASKQPSLAGIAGSEVLYGAMLDVLGEEAGTALLEPLLRKSSGLEEELPGESRDLQAFLDRVRAGGYVPRRLASAIRRFNRWAEANPGATPAACARTLADLWDSYGLRELEEGRPETRLRLFRETVFSRAGEELRGELARLISFSREGRLGFESLLREMSELVKRLHPSEAETYFLARLTYAHLRPMDTADLALVEQGGTRRSDLIVTHRDQAGRYFRVRHAASPREVWSLHRLFRASGIQIRFRAGHQFLIAVDEHGKVLGGLAYREHSPTAVHMEKIVVAPTHRRQGISEELMEDFFSRLRARGVRAVTTGFFRPQYFRRFHFQIDREHAGLVRILKEDDVVEAGSREDWRMEGEEGE